MTEAPEAIYLAHADTATEYGVKVTEALKPHGYPRSAIGYVRADLARPVTAAEAAKVLPLCKVCNQGVDMQVIGGTVNSNGKYWHEFCYKTQHKLDQAKSGWDECALILQSLSQK